MKPILPIFKRLTNISSVRRLGVGLVDDLDRVLTHKEIKSVNFDLVNYGTDGIFFSAYNEDGFILSNGTKIIGPCAVFPNNAFSWNVKDALDISEKSLSLFFLLEPPIELLIIGKGEMKSWVDYRKILDICWKHRLCVEVMPTVSAVGTFNFLNSEGRYVAAGIIPPHRLDHYDEANLKASRILLSEQDEDVQQPLLQNPTDLKLLTSGEYKGISVARSPLAKSNALSSSSSSEET